MQAEGGGQCLTLSLKNPSQVSTPCEWVIGGRRAGNGVAKLMEQKESSRAQEEITTQVKKRNAEKAARKRAIGPRSIAGGFSSFLSKEVGSSRLARVGVSRDHDVQGKMVATGMKSMSNVSFAEATIGKKDTLFNLGVVLSLSEDTTPDVGQGIVPVLSRALSTGVDVGGVFAQTGRTDPASGQGSILTGLVCLENWKPQVAAEGKEERGSRKKARGPGRPPGGLPAHLRVYRFGNLRGR